MPSPDPDALLPLTPLWFNILMAVSDESRHGYGIIKEIELRTEGRMRPATGTVYLALQRLEQDGLIVEAAAGRRGANDNRQRRWYKLTPFGRNVMRAEANRLAAQLGIAFAKNVIDRSVLRRG